MAKSYSDLDVYVLAKELAVRIHRITLEEMPKFEMYEEGGQVRRSSKSIVSTIVEGYGRRKYKNDFILFLTYAIASCDETKAHLEMLHDTGSLKEKQFQELHEAYQGLGAKLYRFRSSVSTNHRTG